MHILEIRPSVHVPLISRPEPPVQVVSPLCRTTHLPLRISHAPPVLGLLDQSGHLVKQPRLRCQGGRDATLIGRKLFELSGKEGWFYALATAVQEQKVGDVVGLDLYA
jgi:hypothetical protein